MENKIKLHKKIQLSGEFKILTGLRIGSNKDSVEIGGVDLPVIRRKDNGEPYIPGSSFKGKMRSLLDIAYGKESTTELKDEDHEIAKLFGCQKRKSAPNGSPSRLIIRDIYLTDSSKELLENSIYTDMPYTEIKAENTINRISGTAKDPRFVERIPAGTIMSYTMIINIITINNEDPNSLESEFLNLINEGKKLLESDYLGGNGSRGYGQIQFLTETRTEVKIEDIIHATA